MTIHFKLSAEEARARADEVRRTSATVLPGLIPVETIDRWNQAFQPLLAAAMERDKDDPNRGPQRFYVTLPFVEPWADPAIVDNDAIMAVVSELVGADGVMCQLATDTPLKGSDYQDLHRDTQLLFPETGAETPPYQLAVNFPLVDVTDAHGPLETTYGSHRQLKADVLQRLARGELEIHRELMALGDVIIRDVRAVHRGTPNVTEEPRPMVVIGYSRRWLHRPEVNIRVPRSTYDRLSERAQRLVRFNPIVADDEIEAGGVESYRVFAY